MHSQLPEDAKTRLAARLTPQMVPPGHDLCQEGDDADCMWILQEGVLSVVVLTQVAAHSFNCCHTYCPCTPLLAVLEEH